MSSILAVLFDLDGTLRHNQPSSLETFVEFMNEMGLHPSLAQIQHGERWNHYYWAVSPNLKADLAQYDGESDAFWMNYAERQLRVMNIAGDLSALAREIHERFRLRYDPDNRVPEDVVPMLIRLRADGYTVGLVSNRTEPLEAVVAELGLKGFFHFTLSAGQAGAWKPDPRIFLRAAALAGCLPEAAVYVGDNYYADVEGARSAGMRPVLVDPKGIFPEPGCPVIQAINELEAVLERLGTKTAGLPSLP